MKIKNKRDYDDKTKQIESMPVVLTRWATLNEKKEE